MNDQSSPELELDFNEQINQRKLKLQALRQVGNPFPNDFHPQHLASNLLQAFQTKDNQLLENENYAVSIAGRIMTRRLMGKASFITLQDRSGKIQVYIKQSEIVEGLYEDFKKWDIGDIIGVNGVLFKTKTGELSVKAHEIRLLTKALRPLPDKWHGLHEREIRYRQRYLDLIVNTNSRNTFIIRTQVIQAIRSFLVGLDFLEVETPMMHVIPGGAAAKPFVTHHNALDMQLYLRIAPELYLKRLVVGGFERVFEINRNFRNEGLSTRHNPEFTMIEFYQAYATYHDLIEMTEKLLQYVTQTVLGTQVIEYQGQIIDFSKPFAKLTLKDSILKFIPELTTSTIDEVESLQSYCITNNIHFEKHWSPIKLQLEIFEEKVETQLIDPTFITEYPTIASPLARKNDNNPDVTDRSELFIAGREIANMFSELNDAEDQAERFKQQVTEKESGDEDAMHYDADYIVALEHGLPPTAGEGIGIDRLVMLLTNSASIRDVLLFPHMRPQN